MQRAKKTSKTAHRSEWREVSSKEFDRASIVRDVRYATSLAFALLFDI
jgi:hypothetical protein